MIGAYLALVLLVTDGDTFRARVEIWPGVETVTAVRLRGIDTPELRGKCPVERERAIAARERLRALLATGPVELRGVTPDKFSGRVDATVMVGNRDLGQVLVSEGLARPYDGGARQGWCP